MSDVIRYSAESGQAGSEPLKPFLKWAGGKGQLLDELTTLIPAHFTGYHEPFLGSGALYFRLFSGRAARGGGGMPSRVYLSDLNPELINCYRVVRDRVEELLPLLAEHKRNHSTEHYYEVRARGAGEPSPLERAARFIYLNKTCYNGLYRVNRRGQFNVPIGSYRNPRIFDPDGLRHAARALQRAELAIEDFREVLTRAQRGDLVYLDPPYYPLTRTASFTGYTRNTFGENEQRDLAHLFRELDRRGCRVMLSNSWTPFVLDLYRDYDCRQVQAARAINSQGNKRGKISELVVLNYAL